MSDERGWVIGLVFGDGGVLIHVWVERRGARGEEEDDEEGVTVNLLLPSCVESHRFGDHGGTKPST